MKIKDKYSNEIICSDLLVEHNDCFSKTILKDFNKLHMFGFSKIEQIYDGTDMIIF